MNRPLIIGVMDGGHANDTDSGVAYWLGALIAQMGWTISRRRRKKLQDQGARIPWP